MNIIFESNNIIFVNVSKDYINDYLLMVNDPDIQHLISTKVKKFTYEDEEKWVNDKLEEKAYVFTMLEKNTTKFIGNIELMDVTSNSAELGISITSTMQNKHYGTEAMISIIDYAFNALNLKCLTAIIFSNNLRSLYCAKKVGFKEYKKVKNVKSENGNSVNDIYLMLKKEDYINRFDRTLITALEYNKEKKL